MDAKEQADFVKLLNILAAPFRVQLTEPMIDAYWFTLSDLRFETVKKAVTRSLREDNFMPSPGRLRALTGVPTMPYHAEWKPPKWQIQGDGGWPALTESLKPKDGES
jgi:hypothetical protein